MAWHATSLSARPGSAAREALAASGGASINLQRRTTADDALAGLLCLGSGTEVASSADLHASQHGRSLPPPSREVPSRAAFDDGLGWGQEGAGAGSNETHGDRVQNTAGNANPRWHVGPEGNEVS